MRANRKLLLAALPLALATTLTGCSSTTSSSSSSSSASASASDATDIAKANDPTAPATGLPAPDPSATFAPAPEQPSGSPTSTLPPEAKDDTSVDVSESLELSVGEWFWVPVDADPKGSIRFSPLTVASVVAADDVPSGKDAEAIRTFPSQDGQYGGILYKAAKPGTETLTVYVTDKSGKETATRYEVTVK